MTGFKRLTIRAKLISIMSFTALLALLLASLALAFNEYFSKQQDTQKQLVITGDLVAWNAAAALAFNDVKTAQELLSRFQHIPSIVSAQLYDIRGGLFARYDAAAKSQSPLEIQQLFKLILKNPKPSPVPGYSDGLPAWFQEWFNQAASADSTLLDSKLYQPVLIKQPQSIHLIRPILLDDELLGVLEIEDDQSELYKLLQRFYLIMGLIFITSGFAIVLISTKLQQIFLAPLLQIIAAMRSVTYQQNFSQRISALGNDEFTEMAQAYNNMLDEIQERDHKLAKQRDSLEIEVKARTQELWEKNLSLNNAIESAISARRHAELANQAKSQFLATMSHEIRTPINSVLGMLELLNKTTLNTHQTDLATTAYLSGQSLLGVINNILDLAKIESGKVELNNDTFNLRTLIEDTVAVLAPQAYLKHLDFILAISPHFQATVIGDPERLRQVLFNLLGNAIKFTDHGEVSLKISQRQAQKAGYVQISFEVFDTGVGISPDKLQLIFDKFTQADGTITRQYGGSGLGLTISKQLVELMGGELSVKTQPHQGSCFYFTLDLALVNPAAEESSAASLATDTAACKIDPALIQKAQHPQLTPQPTSVKGVVLLVDDQILNQKVGRYMLQDLHYRVEIATTGLQAMQAIQNQHFDLILMDCHMPEMDGFETTVLIRQYEADQGLTAVPIIALTADVQSGISEQCLQAGMNGYLSKPFNLQQLESTLRQWLAQSVI